MAILDNPERRHDIDWLRTLVVLLLIPFHAARIFDTHDPFYVQNEVLSEKLTFWWLFIGHALGMQLLFLLSGSATWFALRYRSAKRYAKGRFVRLIIPLIIGVLVVVPPQPYYGMLANTPFSGTILEFYPYFFKAPTTPEGYTGGFTVAHLWFVLFLFLVSMLVLPLFLYFESESGKRLIERLATFLTKPGRIFLFAVPLIGLDRLIDFNWDSSSLGIFFFIFYLTFFIFGYILMADPRFEESIDRHKKTALIFGPGLFFIVRGIEAAGLLPPLIQQLVLHLFYRGTFPWLTIVTVLGYAKQYLNTQSRFLSYFGKASFSIYVLHQTVVVAIGYYVVQWDAGILVKYLTVTVATYAIVMLLYEMFIRRSKLLRLLFGMKA